MIDVVVTLYTEPTGYAVREVRFKRRSIRISTNGVLILLDGDRQVNAWAAGQWRDVRVVE